MIFFPPGSRCFLLIFFLFENPGVSGGHGTSEGLSEGTNQEEDGRPPGEHPCVSGPVRTPADTLVAAICVGYNVRRAHALLSGHRSRRVPLKVRLRDHLHGPRERSRRPWALPGNLHRGPPPPQRLPLLPDQRRKAGRQAEHRAVGRPAAQDQEGLPIFPFYL